MLASHLISRNRCPRSMTNGARRLSSWVLEKHLVGITTSVLNTSTSPQVCIFPFHAARYPSLMNRCANRNCQPSGNSTVIGTWFRRSSAVALSFSVKAGRDVVTQGRLLPIWTDDEQIRETTLAQGEWGIHSMARLRHLTCYIGFIRSASETRIRPSTH